jgi:hypothetical protein
MGGINDYKPMIGMMIEVQILISANEGSRPVLVLNKSGKRGY